MLPECLLLVGAPASAVIGALARSGPYLYFTSTSGTGSWSQPDSGSVLLQILIGVLIGDLLGVAMGILECSWNGDRGMIFSLKRT